MKAFIYDKYGPPQTVCMTEAGQACAGRRRSPGEGAGNIGHCSGLAFHARQAPVLAPHPGVAGQGKVVVEMA